MSEELGFVLFMVFVVAFIGFTIWATIAAPCEWYQFSPQQEIPARCFDTFKGGSS